MCEKFDKYDVWVKTNGEKWLEVVRNSEKR